MSSKIFTHSCNFKHQMELNLHNSKAISEKFVNDWVSHLHSTHIRLLTVILIQYLVFCIQHTLTSLNSGDNNHGLHVAQKE